MGKKSKMQKVNVATDAAMSPDSTPINGTKDCVDELVVSKKALNQKSSVRRRSGRLLSVMKPLQNQVVEQIDLLDSEKEDNDQLHVQNENHKQDNEPRVENETHKKDDEPHVELQPSLVSEPCNQDSGNGPTPNQTIVDERVDHLKKAVEGYKSKIEAITSENHELARKLEIVLAKLEVYETLVRPASYFGGHVSSNGGDAEVGGGGGSGGGAVAKVSSAKKQRCY